MIKFKPHVSALLFGVIAASAAVIAQIVYFLMPPEAYGICLICHARDFLNTLLNPYHWYDASVSSAGLKGIILTVPGVVIGALIGALTSREFKFRINENVIKAFICGFVVVCAGLAISGCPVRLLLRAAYGDISMFVALLVMVFGIWCATVLLKRHSKKTG